MRVLSEYFASPTANCLLALGITALFARSSSSVCNFCAVSTTTILPFEVIVFLGGAGDYYNVAVYVINMFNILKKLLALKERKQKRITNKINGFVILLPHGGSAA